MKKILTIAGIVGLTALCVTAMTLSGVALSAAGAGREAAGPPIRSWFLRFRIKRTIAVGFLDSYIITFSDGAETTFTTINKKDKSTDTLRWVVDPETPLAHAVLP